MHPETRASSRRCAAAPQSRRSTHARPSFVAPPPRIASLQNGRYRPAPAARSSVSHSDTGMSTQASRRARSSAIARSDLGDDTVTPPLVATMPGKPGPMPAAVGTLPTAPRARGCVARRERPRCRRLAATGRRLATSPRSAAFALHPDHRRRAGTSLDRRCQDPNQLPPAIDPGEDDGLRVGWDPALRHEIANAQPLDRASEEFVAHRTSPTDSNKKTRLVSMRAALLSQRLSSLSVRAGPRATSRPWGGRRTPSRRNRSLRFLGEALGAARFEALGAAGAEDGDVAIGRGELQKGPAPRGHPPRRAVRAPAVHADPPRRGKARRDPSALRVAGASRAHCKSGRGAVKRRGRVQERTPGRRGQEFATELAPYLRCDGPCYDFAGRISGVETGSIVVSGSFHPNPARLPGRGSAARVRAERRS